MPLVPGYLYKHSHKHYGQIVSFNKTYAAVSGWNFGSKNFILEYYCNLGKEDLFLTFTLTSRFLKEFTGWGELLTTN